MQQQPPLQQPDKRQRTLFSLGKVVRLEASSVCFLPEDIISLRDLLQKPETEKQTLLTALRCLAGLLGDAVAAVAKRAVLSSYPAYRSALALAAVRGMDPHPASELTQLWQAAQALKDGVIALAAAAGGNAGVRLAAVRHLEQTIMLLTADAIPAVPGILERPWALPAGNAVVSKAALVREAERALAQLLGILSAAVGGEAVVGAVALTCIKAATSVALQRPQFMGRLVPQLLALANSGKLKVRARRRWPWEWHWLGFYAGAALSPRRLLITTHPNRRVCRWTTAAAARRTATWRLLCRRRSWRWERTNTRWLWRGGERWQTG
jgi:hypothetical protein